MYHMFRKIEVRYDEPDKNNNSPKAEKIERNFFEERYIEHITAATETLCVPFL